MICGIPASSALAARREACLVDKPSHSKIIYYGVYDDTIRKAVHLLKFKGVKRLARPMALLLSELDIPDADGLVPVPLAVSRLREREFNQTALVGRHLSQLLGLPLMLDILVKKQGNIATNRCGRKRTVAQC